MVWIVLAAAACVVRFEYVRLYRRKQFKDLSISACLLGFAATLFILRSAHVPIPDPLDWIGAVYKPASKFILSALS
ncbi:hypothetical protein SAMN05216312_103500 [Cohnella sp. OV330]|uniref:hypothetical protein n=1 Tax=Cohnella sp. OV330 TaxID=1855288 RepID=UPI0008DF6694|nr:hypothetical protein [Cohnella sp. OV330]SFB09859.1 hypothetical protein SAMN05216312_103500 [Cohnella sp. OV330]